MIKNLFVLTVLLFGFTPSFSCAEDMLVIKASDYPKGGGMTISAAEALIFDTQDFVFSSAHGDSFGPADTIAIHYMGDDTKGYYSIPYKAGEPVVQIDSATLTPRKSPPFPGFEPGAAVFLMMGREFPEGSLDMGVFADQWILNIRVVH